MRRMDWHMTACLALYAVGIQLALSQMVLLLHTLLILRPILSGALPMSVFWDAYLGALPNVFYLMLPLSAAFAIVFGYAHFVRDHMFTVLAATGTSNWRLAAPGVAIAVAAAAVGASVAHIWAPQGALRLESAKHFARVELPHRLLPERQFVDLEPARLTLYFNEWIATDLAAHVSLYDRRDEREHRVINARLGKFVREGRTLSIVFQNGNLLRFDAASGRAQSVAFREFVTGYAPDANADLARRPAPQFYEQGTAWLLAPPREVREHPDEYRRSQAELHKRLAAPLFVLCYAPLVVGFAFFLNRTGHGVSAFLSVMPLVLSCAHIALIVLFETGVRSGPAVVFLGYSILLALAAAGMGLIQLHEAGRAPVLAHWWRQRLERCTGVLRHLSSAPVGDRAGERADAAAAKAGGGGIT